MNKNSKVILWDFDNTLAYRDGMWSKTIHDLLIENGYNHILYEDIRPYMKSGFPWDTPEVSHKEFFKDKQWWEVMHSHFAKVIEQLGVEEEAAISIAEGIRDGYLNFSKWYVYEDTISCLEELVNKGYENIIISNHVPELEELVSRLGIDKYFSRVYTSAKVGYEKPNEEIYKHVLKDVDKEKDIIMIGDNYNADVQGALKLGLKAILVRKENINNYEFYCSDLRNISQIIEDISKKTK